jgi:2-oxoisovalerate dehydrogenase E2 component (dihydrolipoyl transacylase)
MMSTTIVMPQLGESVAEGVIGKWLKAEGDRIEKDEPIVEIITDKVNAEIPSPVAGVLEKITQPEGATVAVGQEIAVIGDGGNVETVQTGATSAAPGPAESMESRSVGAFPQPHNGGGRPHFGGDATDGGGLYSGAGSQTATAAALASRTVGATQRGERVRSSPLVRRLAEQYDISLAEVPGTGIGGRVSKQDLLAYVEMRQQPAPAAQAATGDPIAAETVGPVTSTAAVPPTPTPAPTQAFAHGPSARELRPGEELVPLSPLRRMIADRMTQSVFTIPHAMTMSEVDVTKVVRYREGRKESFRRQEGVALSYVAFVIKAVVEALKEYPGVNAEWSTDGIIVKKDININVAVDAPEGLTTPVIHRADERSLSGLSKAINDLATRARDKRLKIEDMQGGTFTVNNTGALGSTGGFSIINYPQAGILSAAQIVKRPVVVEEGGEDLIAVRSMVNLSFSFDHRLLDGGYAAGFVRSVKAHLENWPEDYPLY